MSVKDAFFLKASHYILSILPFKYSFRIIHRGTTWSTKPPVDTWMIYSQKHIYFKDNLFSILKFNNAIFLSAGLLRYKVDFQSMQLDDEEIDNLYDIDDY